MAKNKVIKTFTANGTWTAPAGVKSVRLTAVRNISPFPFSQPGFSGCASGFLDTFGNLYGWGTNNEPGHGVAGGLGVNNSVTNAFSSPILVVGGYRFRSATVLYGQAGQPVNSNTIAITDQGTAYTWGLNTNGQLGDGTVTPRSSPVAVVGGYTFKKAVINSSTDNAAMYGITPTGQVYAWGFNNNGQLGVGDVTPRSSPTLVSASLLFTDVIVGASNAGASGAGSVIGLTLAGVAYGWGLNGAGQLGDGTVTVRSTPTLVVGSLTFKKIVTGVDSSTNNNAYFLGLTTGGQTYAWGGNTSGNLGVGDVAARSSPTLVVGALTFTDLICTSQGTSFGITATGAVYAWGKNTKGYLGDGTTVDKSSPVLVTGGLSFKKLFTFSDVVGQNQSSIFGLTTTDSLYAWGGNVAGILGVNDVIARSSPVLVVGGNTFVDMGSSQGCVFGATPNGTIYAWGQNGGGQLGDGTVVDKSSPVLVVGSYTVANVTPATQTQVVTVVPGTTYTISMAPELPSFGAVPLLSLSNLLTVEYFA